MAQQADLDIVWRAFELRPEGAPPLDQAYRENGFRNYIEPMARELGVEMHLPKLQCNTRLAHEAALFARTQGRGQEMADAIFRAYWVDGRDIGQVEVLCDVALQAGVDPVLTRGALDDRTMKAEVEAELRQARLNLIDAVPYFIFAGRYGARGLQSEAQLLKAIARVQGEGLIQLEE